MDATSKSLVAAEICGLSKYCDWIMKDYDGIEVLHRRDSEVDPPCHDIL